MKLKARLYSSLTLDRIQIFNKFAGPMEEFERKISCQITYFVYFHADQHLNRLNF